MTVKIKKGFVVFLLLFIFLVTGCGGSGSNATPPAPSTPQIPPASENTQEPAVEDKAADINKLISIADVGSILEMKDLKLVDRDPSKGAGGDLNFTTSSGELVLMVLINDASMYESWKNYSGNFNEDVFGIGDEAFNGPGSGDDLHILTVRKGNTSFSLSSFFNFADDLTPYFDEEQLKDLARNMVSRIN
jgi:hypothetical protein